MIEIYNKYVPGFDQKIGQKKPSIKEYLVKNSANAPAIIICQGGAYIRKADHEGEPIAKWLNTLGVNAFIVDYRLAPYRHPYPLMDLQRAIRFVRYHHEDYNLNPKKIGVLGFSAGGHLAASACVYFDYGKSIEDAHDEIDRVSSRPDISILCYPVITLGKYTHIRSRNNLLGEGASNELINSMSVERHVKNDTPPAFIWHTATDGSVPMQNSIMYAEALKEKEIPFELHIFPEGRHGLGMLNEVPYVTTRWIKLCEEFLREMKFII